MIYRLSRGKWIRLKEAARRVDQIAGDLNLLLLVFAAGIATLNVTFLVTQKVVEHLPRVIRVVQVTACGQGN